MESRKPIDALCSLKGILHKIIKVNFYYAEEVSSNVLARGTVSEAIKHHLRIFFQISQ